MRVSVGLVALLLPSLAQAFEPAQAFHVGVGLSSPGDAEKSLARLEREKDAVAAVLVLPPGYPRVLEGAELPDLRKGSKLATLGVCPADADSIFKALDVVIVGTWKRETAARPAGYACPALQPGWLLGDVAMSKESAGDILRHLRDDHFRGLALARAGGQGARVVMYLRDWRLDLIDWKEVAFTAGCTAKLAMDQGVLSVEETCAAPAEPSTKVLRYAGIGGKITQVGGLEAERDVRALVWGGGSAAEAKAALERWGREKEAFPEQVRLPAGYPKVVKSDAYPGLTPGQEVVLLGVCPAEQLGPAWKAMRGFERRIEAKKVRPSGGEPACPRASGPPLQGVTRVPAGRMELTAVSWAGERGYPWAVSVFLRDGNGALVDWSGRTEQDLDRNWKSRCGVLEKVEVVNVGKGDQIRATLDCVLMNTDVGKPYQSEVTYSVSRGELVIEVVDGKP